MQQVVFHLVVKMYVPSGMTHGKKKRNAKKKNFFGVFLMIPFFLTKGIVFCNYYFVTKGIVLCNYHFVTKGIVFCNL